jgi:branched-chain amino acid transport system permease protein
MEFPLPMDPTTLIQLMVSGLTIGSVYSLVGLGFSLTLRATELINFAQGELVTVGAFIGLSLLATFNLPFIAVFAIASLATGLIGIALEQFVLRPILVRKAPLPNLLIATLGVSVALQALAIVIWGREPIPYPKLFAVEVITIGGISVQVLNLWILGLAVSMMAGLQFFFQRTLTGISWRAAALDPSTAALYGVSRRWNVAMTFGLSAALAGGAGALMAPLFFASFGLGHSVLTKAFAAAAIGGFGILGTMVGGLVLGIVETLAAGMVSSEYKNVIMYAILLGILMFFFRPKMPSGRSIAETSKVVVSKPLPRTRMTLLLAVAVALVWLLLPLVAGTYMTRIFALATVSAIAVLGLQLIVGFTGQLSFGHAAFVGIGAYTAGILSVSLKLPFVLTFPLAGIAAALTGLIVAPVLRLSGHYLAIATLALGEIAFLLINNLKNVTNGAYGLYGIPAPAIGPLVFDSDGSFFVLATLVMYGVLVGMNRLTNSRFGRCLVAVRENELAALASGIDAARYKIQAFVIGTFCAGLSGALYAHYMAYISPDNFTFVFSVEMVTMVVIGGLGSMVGGIIGAFVAVTMPEYLRWLADYRLVVYGGLLILFMMFLPGGLMDLVRRGAHALSWLRPRQHVATEILP